MRENPFPLFDQSLNRLKLFVFCVAHHLEDRHLHRGWYCSGQFHLAKTGLAIPLLSRSDAICQQMDLESSRNQVMHRLVDTDVRFDATNENLLRADGIQLRMKWFDSARTESCFLDNVD